MTREMQSANVLLRQKEKIDEFLKLPVKGRFWYVIDYQWWNKWCTYVETVTNEDSFDVASDDYPGEIDNTALLTDDGKLKPNLLREQDITLIPEEAWNLFVDYYGCVHTDTSVFRRTSVQTPAGRDVVEIYPPCFAFLDVNTEKKYFEGTYSEAQTIGELKSLVRKNLNLIDAATVRLFVGDSLEELTEDDATIGEASLERQKVLYVKLDVVNGPNVKAVGTTGYRPAANGTLSSGFLSAASSIISPYTTRQLPGVCGLSNLGNTCFMNSAIQCMSNVPKLTAFFRNPQWKQDINRFNPLGTRGRIATAYADLIDHMWSGQYAYENPRTLKREIALIASQFSGYAQHDSHELLVFLLDGLHEDLNRVKDKPYIEFKDAGNRPDKVVADEAWQNHLARNDSIIVELFHGQLKSTVVCPTCHYKSVTFDPFASLNLPLPDLSRYTRYVYVWPWIPVAASDLGPIRIELSVPMEFYVRDLLALLQQQRLPYQGCKYYLTDVYHNSIGRPWHLEHIVRDRYGPPVFAYELPPGELIPVRFHQPSSNTSGWVGIPFYISVPRSEPVVDELFLIRSIASRLRAIGIQSLDPVDTIQTNMNSLSGLNDTKAGDDPFAGPSSRTHRTGENSRLVVTHDAPKPAASLTDYADKLSNGDECPIGRFLVGRVCLLDDLNRDLTNSSILPGMLEHNMCRISVECTGSSLQAQLDEILRRMGPAQNSYSVPSKINLAKCFEKFVIEEKLGTRDLWYCSRCKGEKQASKKFDLWSLPEVLVIQLKRFRSILRWRDKIDTLVDFPIRGLDLTPWVVSKTNERFIYDLIAVSNHMGHLGGGHYTAFALNHITGRWYLFDDASTREIDESCIVTEAAYVLVYQRVPTSSRGSSTNTSNVNPYPRIGTGFHAEESSSMNIHSTPMYINDDDLTNIE